MATMKMPTAVGTGGSSSVAFGVEPAPSQSGLTELKITTGFSPKKIMWTSTPTNYTYPCDYYWDNDKNANKFYGRQGGVNLIQNGANVGGNSYWYGLKRVESDGFVLEKVDTSAGVSYVTGIWWAASAE